MSLDPPDLRRLSRAPWKTNMLTIHANARVKDGPTEQVEVVDADFDPASETFSNFLKTVCRCDCTKGKFETELANAQFIALARNAFAGDKEALAWWEKHRAR